MHTLVAIILDALQGYPLSRSVIEIGAWNGAPYVVDDNVAPGGSYVMNPKYLFFQPTTPEEAP